MKILQVIPVYSYMFGGTVAVVRSISKELAKRHEVVVYTTTALNSNQDFKARTEKLDGYTVRYFNRTFKQLCYSNIFGQLNFSYDMMQAMRQHLSEFDVVHVHSWQQFPDITASYFAKKHKIPYVLQVHGSIPVIGKRFQKLVFDALFGYEILKNASKFIALSPTEVQQYQNIGLPRDKIEIVPNGIEVTKYGSLQLKGTFKKKLKIEDETKIILYLGRIHQTKRIDLLIKAYKNLSNYLKLPKTILVIIGPDDGYLNAVRSMVASLGLTNSVVIIDFVNQTDKIAAFIDAEVFVTPVFYGFPVTFLEACMVGTPIVTTNIGDSLDWINDNVGFVTGPTTEGLARAIYSIISDSALRQRLSRNCLSSINNQFSIERVVEELEGVYTSVARVN